MKRRSEGVFGEALRAVDDSVPTFVFRVPDPKMGGGVTNWKPCDFMVWSLAVAEVTIVDTNGVPLRLNDSSWFECKDTPAVQSFPFSDIRPSQWQGIREARRLGIPYWVAIYWRRHVDWTISDGVRLELYRDEMEAPSVPRELLMTRFGINATPRDLASTLKSILAGEVR